MRSLSRSPGSAPPRPDSALRGVVAVSPVATDRPGGQGAADAAPTDGEHLDLVATGPGLVIGRTHNSGLAVPALVPWSIVTCAAVTDDVLAVTVTDDGWLGAGTRALTVHVPPAELPAFLEAVAAGRTSAGADRSRSPVGGALAVGAGALAGVRSSATRLMRSLQPGGGEPQHGLGRRRVAPVLVGLMALLLLAGSTSVSFDTSASGVVHRPHPAGADGQVTGNQAQAAQVHLSPALAAATSAPAPAPPSLAGTAPLQPHEIFGYAPYWTLPQSSGFDVQDLTTLAYFSVDANGDGTLSESGAGWNGYESQDLVDLVTRSHAAGARVVLTVTCFSQSALDAITSDPDAGARLSSALIAAVSAKNLDGVNFDFEGEGSADQSGLTRLITQVSGALHAANPHWQVTMATYASAAGDSNGFYNVAALAPALDGFFVMAYDMNDRSTPSATAPLIGGGFNDTEALQQFTAVVPAQKVILGVPYYGYDWPTTDGTKSGQATGGETPLSDGVIAASGHPSYWDPSTDTPWTSYEVGQQWHETYFDDPTSLAMKAQLAASFHIAGLGIWALGMDGNDPAMLAALLGNAPAVKDFQAGPTSTGSSASSTTAPSAPAGSGFTTGGVWDGARVPLRPVAPPASDGSALYLGTLGGLTTTDPALTCLQGGPALKVWSFSTLPGVDVVVASQPADCATAMWTFTPSAASGAGSGTAPGGSPTTSTTTTTTTTAPPPPPTTTTSTTTSTTTTTTLTPSAPAGTTPTT